MAHLLALKLGRGEALILLATALYGGFTLALRLTPKIHWQSLMSVTCFGAIVPLLIPFGWAVHSQTVTWPDAQGWMVVAYAATLPSLVSGSAYIKAVSWIGPNRAGLFINLIPIFGVILSVLLLGETLRPYHFIALGFVIGGIVLSERGRIRA
jgi:drug/metabolite transporter (DMT)-like permease